MVSFVVVLSTFILEFLLIIHSCSSSAQEGVIKYEDLSYPLNKDTIVWTGWKKFELLDKFTSNADGRFYAANAFSVAEHCGTHMDAPYHFNENAWKIGNIPFERLIAPGIVVDASEQAAGSSDYLLTVDDLEDWEKKNGQIPRNGIIILRFGWGKKYFISEKEYFGTDDKDAKHFPGLSEDAAKWLVKHRHPYGIGVDTASVDAGVSQIFEAHRVFGAANVFLLENVANVEKLPLRGFTLMAFPLNITEGTGSPCRIVAQIGNIGPPIPGDHNHHTNNGCGTWISISTFLLLILLYLCSAAFCC